MSAMSLLVPRIRYRALNGKHHPFGAHRPRRGSPSSPAAFPTSFSQPALRYKPWNPHLHPPDLSPPQNHPNSTPSPPKKSPLPKASIPNYPPPTRALTDCRMSIENLKTFDPFAEADEDTGQVKQTQQDYIHIRIQQRNGRKTLTTVQGLPKKFDQKKILKVIKKKFACNGTIVSDAEMGEVVQLQGDQRKDVQDFLTDKKEGLGLDAKTIKVSHSPARFSIESQSNQKSGPRFLVVHDYYLVPPRYASCPRPWHG
ncbi:uncharacterized protein J4E92_005358 [Alternaria infectoria]|uniref:uncharacterized protein n=1 Tax=Alternaria infectoria TaxID=45303 RepID=UPI00221E9371|nr:uncharacterized protein J4E92_005358 [Alternaria infectoria]KAI4929692.1 hypothetical protein J4E92_005358 [Alternaria infectoria]